MIDLSGHIVACKILKGENIMAKKIHIYDITMSNGEEFKNIRIEGSISRNYSGIATDFIPVENTQGQTVELVKYQIIKAELVNIEE